MSTYYVEFTAYVNERIRPEGFPHDIKIQETLENIENTAHLQFKVQERFVQLVSSAGLIAMKDPSLPLDSGVITFDKRWFIPWHMFTHMGLRVKLMSPTISNPQDTLSPTESSQESKQESVN